MENKIDSSFNTNPYQSIDDSTLPDIIIEDPTDEKTTSLSKNYFRHFSYIFAGVVIGAGLGIVACLFDPSKPPKDKDLILCKDSMTCLFGFCGGAFGLAGGYIGDTIHWALKRNGYFYK